MHVHNIYIYIYIYTHECAILTKHIKEVTWRMYSLHRVHTSDNSLLNVERVVNAKKIVNGDIWITRKKSHMSMEIRAYINMYAYMSG